MLTWKRHSSHLSFTTINGWPFVFFLSSCANCLPPPRTHTRTQRFSQGPSGARPHPRFLPTSALFPNPNTTCIDVAEAQACTEENTARSNDSSLHTTVEDPGNANVLSTLASLYFDDTIAVIDLDDEQLSISGMISSDIANKLPLSYDPTPSIIISAAGEDNGLHGHHNPTSHGSLSSEFPSSAVGESDQSDE